MKEDYLKNKAIPVDKRINNMTSNSSDLRFVLEAIINQIAKTPEAKESMIEEFLKSKNGSSNEMSFGE